MSAMHDLPTGTVTFLFTDLEGSTRLWEQHPDAMRDALARHDEILRGAIHDHRGVVFSEMGDGMAAAFASAAEAVGACVDAQLRLAGESWGETGPLRVRMGMHTGDGSLKPDGQYVNAPLNRCARLMAIAHGAQVVCSETVEPLVREALPDGVGLIDLGEHRLRDVARPMQVFQLVHPELPRDFPPLRSTAALRGNLPITATSFVGRDADVARIVELVDDARPLTLIGVGGVGKTRLAVEVASRMAGRYRDGAWFCDLSPIADAADLPATIARASGIDTRVVAHPEHLVDFLGAKDVLLVLDNCEHVIDAVATLVELVVQRCPDVRILATSREALAIDGERLAPVRPLPVEVGTDDPSAAADSPPVRLFCDRAAAVRPGFVLTERNVTAVVEVCRALDGIPLAIELAAARVRALSPAEILERLDQRLALLGGTRRGTTARHETLRAAIDWSYNLLDPDEQTLLAHASVFSGGFKLDAIEAVVAPHVERIAVLDAVTGLVDKSLVTVDDRDDETRYRLLETIRQYALEQLGTAETAAARDRHLAHFVGVVERAGPEALRSGSGTWVRRLAAEIDNLRAAVEWAVDTQNVELAARLVAACPLAHTEYCFPLWSLGWLAGAVLALPAASSDPRYPQLLMHAADHAYALGDFDRARTLARDTLDRAGPEDPAVWRAERILSGAAAHGGVGDPVVHIERALAAARLRGDTLGYLLCLPHLAIALVVREPPDIERGEREARNAVTQARATAHEPALSMANYVLGFILTVQADPEGRGPLLASLGADAWPNGTTLVTLALLEASLGNRADALDALQRAMTSGAEYADPLLMTLTLRLGASALAHLGDPATAAEILAATEGGPLPPTSSTGVNRALRAALDQTLDSALSPSERDAARARGLTMGARQVVAHVLDRIAVLQAESGARDA